MAAARAGFGLAYDASREGSLFDIFLSKLKNVGSPTLNPPALNSYKRAATFKYTYNVRTVVGDKIAV